MYVKITFKWLKKTRKITFPQINDKKSLIKLIKLTFDFNEEEIIGVMDSKGKFYQMSYLTQNIKSFDQSQLQLITSEIPTQVQKLSQIGQHYELNIEPISFASNTPNQFQNDYNPLNEDSALQQFIQLPQDNFSSVIGQIHNLKIFEQTILQNELTIIIQSNKKVQNFDFPYYFIKGKQKKIYIYQQKKKICEMPIFDQFTEVNRKVVINLIDMIKSSENLFVPKNNQININNDNNHIAKNNKNNNYMFKQHNQPNDLQLLGSSQPAIRINHNHNQHSNLFHKPKIQHQRKHNFISQTQSRSQQQSQQLQRYDIPIIIRKSNNKIQKVTASYPLTQQQMQAINSLLELEIQGLFSDEEINKVKMMVLGQNSRVLQLLNSYSAEKMDVNELCKNLTQSLKRKESTKN